jgi:outer membrane protein OmpA-like peptidoglycan-associated protein
VDSGPISGTNIFQFGVAIEASYSMPIEPHLALRPSLNAFVPFTRIDPSLWNFSLNASLALEYHLDNIFGPEPMTLAVEPARLPVPPQSALPTPTIIPPKKTMLTVSVKALGVEKNGKEVEEPVVSIERMHVTEVFPMLHYIFFDDGSSDIPSRYYHSTSATRSQFHEKELFTANALDIHHHVLDILGKRLAEHPDAGITLVGTRSEHSENDSLANNLIGLARAKSVQDYLIHVWGISTDRIHLRGRSLPEAASDDHNAFGQAENRRVEIIPSSPIITAPLWTERIERVATPPQINFEPEITANAGIRSATISVYQHGRILYRIDALDSTSNSYNWTIDGHSMPDDAPSAEDSLRYVFTAIDSLGDTAQAGGVIHLHREHRDTSHHAEDTTGGKQLERYSLILFDYSSSTLDKKESDAIIREMATAIEKGSNVVLTGHTDKTGDDAFNDKLARERVGRAEDMLEAAVKQLHRPQVPIVTESHGSRDNLFDNSIPEGRVLSRTVRATIENGGE